MGVKCKPKICYLFYQDRKQGKLNNILSMVTHITIKKTKVNDVYKMQRYWLSLMEEAVGVWGSRATQRASNLPNWSGVQNVYLIFMLYNLYILYLWLH